MESWQKILGIIEFVIVLIVLLFLIGVIVVIIKNRKLEFNMYWKSRALLASSAFIWVVFLMLGNEYLWNTDGLFGIKSHSAAICGLHLFFTVGLAEPLFFLSVLFTLKSKTNRDKGRNNNNNQSGIFRIFTNRLNFEDPNDYVYLCAFICSLPLIIVHIVLLILDALNDKVNIAYTVFDNEESKCLVPIVSTAAFAIFYVLFLLFFIFISRKFSKTIINRSLINRIRLLQFSFIAFLPLEVAIKVVLIFTLNIGKISQALFNAFFFVDIVVLLIGVLEFALFPILDSLGYYSSSIKLWKFKFLNRNNNEGRGMITNDGNNNNSSSNNNNNDYEKNDENNISLTTISTNISSTPNSLIPIGDYEKQLKNNNNSDNNSDNNNKNKNNLEVGGGGGGGDNKNHILSQQTELEKLKIKHKSPILDRVRDTDPINLPPSEPLSTPLSSSPQQPPSHERKKSRRFSLSGKKKSQTVTPTPSSSSSSSPNNQSPPLQPQQSQPRYLQPTPVDDFKNNLFKYSQTGYK
ncbi:hypothetical protein DDB_G0286809 [Dictyostelium discoideum AX4]|uniref:Uncharacterized protein n=1 Tax=Dictyostelium discoideum TaxID=44689 RepID=Q54LH2_DICDI|nr:hypothetical protein DDB_G0286809 [Dictyostelium discoideum AX4]EAL64160.1 hypothetical protein DDB_G0286809 [Dictyostelium discoideum AX4]|eukprot:XP_637589.1 hypothetical protein DDB_G0286809 [Dictyostelium discoideum AX4]